MESYQTWMVHLIVWRRRTTWKNNECVLSVWLSSSRNVYGPQNSGQESPDFYTWAWECWKTTMLIRNLTLCVDKTQTPAKRPCAYVLAFLCWRQQIPARRLQRATWCCTWRSTTRAAWACTSVLVRLLWLWKEYMSLHQARILEAMCAWTV